MMKSQSIALSLSLKEVLDPEFVREVLDRKGIGYDTPLANLLHSSTSATLVRKKILATFTAKSGVNPRLSDLASYTPSELRSMAKLGAKTLRWLEEYLQLLGIVLPHSKSVHGMSPTARELIASI